ncbi:AroM family protein [Vagococcus elongatus]|uniref:AroM family protein n=1 Tax=Vagococcus elongatus TaxID=180344 RepID=A0A430AIA4_9ENTE|nr:AroM family protein [Vagococcus elongatus]RSU07637.1 hypothetical protein CBF29_13275 [Vagococcus elongatus]
MKRTVFITIGEAPRWDIQDSFDLFFADCPQVKQVGVLNNFTYQEAMTQLKPQIDDEIVVSTFCDGRSLSMSKSKVEKKLQELIDRAEKELAEVVVIFCTAEFSNLVVSSAELIEPEYILLPYIQQKFGKKKLGVIVPIKEQVTFSEKKWREYVCDPVFCCASPYQYDETDFLEAGLYFKNLEVEAIILDCMGYTRRMSAFLREVTQKPVFQSNELLFEFVYQKIKE